MDTANTFISTGISAGLYILYKVAQRYYFKSGCHDNTLEIAVVDRTTEKAVDVSEVKHQIEVELGQKV